LSDLRFKNTKALPPGIPGGDSPGVPAGLQIHHRFEIIRTKANRRRAIISVALIFFNQMMGVYVLANYGILIYQSLELKGTIPLLLNACWSTYTIFGNTATAFLVDRYGRRPLFLIGITGCLTCLADQLTVYLVLICPAVICLPIVYFFFPESKGRTLEEISTLFGTKTSWPTGMVSTEKRKRRFTRKPYTLQRPS
jgi:MFS family permease